MHHAPRITNHVSCIMNHASCIMHHESCTVNHASWIMHHVSWISSWIMNHKSWIMNHESCIMNHGQLQFLHVSAGWRPVDTYSFRFLASPTITGKATFFCSFLFLKSNQKPLIYLSFISSCQKIIFCGKSRALSQICLFCLNSCDYNHNVITKSWRHFKLVLRKYF